MSIGSFIGFYKSLYQAYDSKTIISRKATFPDTSLYLFTAVIPMWTLEMYFTAIVWSLNFFLKLYIYLYRAPSNENCIGITSDM